MLDPRTEAIVRSQIAWRLDCDPTDLLRQGALVKVHGPRLAGYHGLYVWLMDAAALISAPPQWVRLVESAVAGLPIETLRDPAFWRSALGARIERIVGPSYQGYTDAPTFHPAPTTPGSTHLLVRRLSSEERPALERLAAACSPQEWQDSAIYADHDPIFALERAGELVAAASAPDDGPGVASVGVITHPAWRGRGYGSLVVSALTADRLAGGAVLHYQTLRSNGASVAVAHALGFHDLATALGIRLRP
jgi:GNAT superfamily N-acetyltransferase